MNRAAQINTFGVASERCSSEIVATAGLGMIRGKR